MTHFIWRATSQLDLGGDRFPREQGNIISVTNDRERRRRNGREPRPRTNGCPFILSLFCCESPDYPTIVKLRRIRNRDYAAVGRITGREWQRNTARMTSNSAISLTHSIKNDSFYPSILIVAEKPGLRPRRSLPCLANLTTRAHQRSKEHHLFIFPRNRPSSASVSPSVVVVRPAREP